MERKTRRRFTREFKLEAAQLARREGVSVAQVADDLGVGAGVLRRWCRQHASGPGKTAPRDAELAGLDPRL